MPTVRVRHGCGGPGMQNLVISSQCVPVANAMMYTTVLCIKYLRSRWRSLWRMLDFMTMTCSGRECDLRGWDFVDVGSNMVIAKSSSDRPMVFESASQCFHMLRGFPCMTRLDRGPHRNQPSRQAPNARAASLTPEKAGRPPPGFPWQHRGAGDRKWDFRKHIF